MGVEARGREGRLGGRYLAPDKSAADLLASRKIFWHSFFWHSGGGFSENIGGYKGELVGATGKIETNMAKKLSWTKIRESYPNQWVELIDYEWADSESEPRSGIVKRHAKDRKKLHKEFMKDPVENSAIVFTGTLTLPHGSVFSANLHQFHPNK